jgi:hypothetical protein
MRLYHKKIVVLFLTQEGSVMSNFIAFKIPDKNVEAYLELHKKIDENKVIEMKGLGFPGGTVQKATSSNNCAVYVLKNGTRLTKYWTRYLIDAPDIVIADSTLKLLGIKQLDAEWLEVNN